MPGSRYPAPVPGASAQFPVPVRGARFPVPGASARCQHAACWWHLGPVAIGRKSQASAGGGVVGCVELRFKLNSSSDSYISRPNIVQPFDSFVDGQCNYFVGIDHGHSVPMGNGWFDQV